MGGTLRAATRSHPALRLALVVALHVLILGAALYAPARNAPADVLMRVELRTVSEPRAIPEERLPPPPIRRAATAPQPVLAAAPHAPETQASFVVPPQPAVFARTEAADAAGVASVVPPPAAPAPVLVPPRFDADYLNNPPPDYPPLSRRLHEEGRVLLRVRVAIDGQPAQVDLRATSGYERLDLAAIAAVRRWRFVPARLGDAAVPSDVLVPIDFRLR